MPDRYQVQPFEGGIPGHCQSDLKKEGRYDDTQLIPVKGNAQTPYSGCEDRQVQGFFPIILKASFPALHLGHTHVSGSWSNGVFAAIPCWTSPSASLYMYPHRVQNHLVIVYQ